MLPMYSDVPDFAAIKSEHFAPAFAAAAETVRRNAARIAAMPPDTGTAEIIAAFESLFHPTQDLKDIADSLGANAASEAMSAAGTELTNAIGGLEKEVFQLPSLIERFKAAYADRGNSSLDDDDRAMLIRLRRSFESGGAFLSSAAQRQTLKALDEKLVMLSAQFSANMTAAARQQAVHITDPAELDGVNESDIAAFAKAARDNDMDGWLFIPERLKIDALLTQAHNESFRRKIHQALNRIGKEPPYDNRPVLRDLQKARHEKATLLGYRHYAEYARAGYMYKDLQSVQSMAANVGRAVFARFEQDMRTLEDYARREGGPQTLQPWDVAYWAMRQKEALYNYDSRALSEHLEADTILQAFFGDAGRIHRLAFKEAAYPTLHPDIKTYDVFQGGRRMGVVHLDLFARAGTKRSGAWISVPQRYTPDRPLVVTINMNLTKPADPSQPCLMTTGDARTLFHEGGHDLHNILGCRTKYRSMSGSRGPTDFTEFFSTINERWIASADSLRRSARHYKTGAAPSDDLLDAYDRSRQHFAYTDHLKLVQNTLYDIAFHSIHPDHYTGDDALEQSVTIDSPYAAHARPYPLTRFNHLFDREPSIYAAGYVNYLIAEILAEDGAELFERSGDYDPAACAALTAFYEGGSGGDLQARYVAFRGREATPAALLRAIGVAEAPAAPPAASRHVKPGIT